MNSRGLADQGWKGLTDLQMTTLPPESTFTLQVLDAVARLFGDDPAALAKLDAMRQEVQREADRFESHIPPPAPPVCQRQMAEPRLQKPTGPYTLRIVSVTYLGDDAAVARGIEEFLRLSRLRRALRRQPEEPIGD